MNWAVIMAGGSGTRFWPESRRGLPKQFLGLFGKKTLLEQTLDRLLKVVPRERILVFVQKNKVALTRKLLGLSAAQVVGEPVGRNTAPCAVWAASLALKKDPAAVLGIFPADHFIQNKKMFAKTLRAAYRTAEQEGMPVTLGVKPDSPHTGYGYLEMGTKLRAWCGSPVHRLKRFHEKPGPAAAKRYFGSGKFLWNAGIFIWRADCLLETARKHLPRVFETVTAIVNEKIPVGRLKSLFGKLPGISIDYGLMEKIPGQILTIPVSMGWNDVGGWSALRGLLAEDAKGNVATGKTLLVDSSGNLVRSKTKLIAAVGLKGHVVVESNDAILICPMKETESIRKIVFALEQKKYVRYL